MYMPKSATLIGGPSQSQSTTNQQPAYMPKTAVPQQAQANTPQNNNPSVGGFLTNLVGSAANTAGSIGHAVMHPIQTAENAIKLPLGEGAVLASKIAPNRTLGNDPVSQFLGSSMNEANNFNTSMKNRYGGPSQIANTIYTDPVGAALDTSSLLDGGASAVGSVTNKLGMVDKLGMADKLATAANVTNPVNAIGGLLKVAGKGTGIIGNAVQDTGASLPLRGLRPSPSQLTNFKKATGEDLGAFLQRNNVTGNFGANAQTAIDDLQEKYDALAKDSKTSVPLKDIATQFKPIVQQWQQSLNPILRAKAEDIKGYLTAMAHKYGMDNSFTPEGITAADGAINPDAFKGTMSIQDVLNEKRELSDVLKSPQFNSMVPEQAQLHTNLYHGLKGAINEATKATDPKGIGVGPIGKEEQKWIGLKNIADRQGNLGRGSKPLSLTGSILSTALGAFGGMMGGLPGAAMGLGAGPILDAVNSSPRVIGAESKALQGTGRAVKGVGNFESGMANNPGFQNLLRLIRNASSLNQNTQPQNP